MQGMQVLAGHICIGSAGHSCGESCPLCCGLNEPTQRVASKGVTTGPRADAPFRQGILVELFTFQEGHGPARVNPSNQAVPSWVPPGLMVSVGASHLTMLGVDEGPEGFGVCGGQEGAHAAGEDVANNESPLKDNPLVCTEVLQGGSCRRQGAGAHAEEAGHGGQQVRSQCSWVGVLRSQQAELTWVLCAQHEDDTECRMR